VSMISCCCWFKWPAREISHRRSASSARRICSSYHSVAPGEEQATSGLRSPCNLIYFRSVRIFGHGGRKWDKKNRSSWGLPPGVDPPRSEPEAVPLLLKRKILTGEEYCFSATVLEV
jgi:hypothetical protein